MKPSHLSKTTFCSTNVPSFRNTKNSKRNKTESENSSSSTQTAKKKTKKTLGPRKVKTPHARLLAQIQKRRKTQTSVASASSSLSALQKASLAMIPRSTTTSAGSERLEQEATNTTKATQNAANSFALPLLNEASSAHRLTLSHVGELVNKLETTAESLKARCLERSKSTASGVMWRKEHVATSQKLRDLSLAVHLWSTWLCPTPSKLSNSDAASQVLSTLQPLHAMPVPNSTCTLVCPVPAKPSPPAMNGAETTQSGTSTGGTGKTDGGGTDTTDKKSSSSTTFLPPPTTEESHSSLTTPFVESPTPTLCKSPSKAPWPTCEPNESTSPLPRTSSPGGQDAKSGQNSTGALQRSDATIGRSLHQVRQVAERLKATQPKSLESDDEVPMTPPPRHRVQLENTQFGMESLNLEASPQRIPETPQRATTATNASPTAPATSGVAVQETNASVESKRQWWCPPHCPHQQVNHDPMECHGSWSTHILCVYCGGCSRTACGKCAHCLKRM